MSLFSQKSVSLRSRYNQGRLTIGIIVIFSIINIYMLLTSYRYLVFSSYFSMLLVNTGMLLAQQALNTGPLITFVILAVVSLIPYAVLAILAGKHYGFMIGAVALLFLDTVLVVVDVIMTSIKSGLQTYLLTDIFIHLIFLASVCVSTYSGFKLRQSESEPRDETKNNM